MVPSPSDVMMEREGLWTRVELREDCIVVYRSATYIRGAIAGAIMATAVAAGFVYGLAVQVQSAIAVAVSLAAVAVCMLIWKGALSKLRRLKGPVLVIAEDCVLQSQWPAAPGLNPASIQAVEVRENLGRSGDDMALWQTYLHTHEEGGRILIHQRPRWRKTPDDTLARTLAERWGVPLLLPGSREDGTPPTW